MSDARTLSYHTARLDLLRQLRNADGGWGYRAGGQSWLEPTCLALLALAGNDAGGTLDKTWKLLESWQLPDGGYRPTSGVSQPCWAASLSVTAHCVYQVFNPGFDKALTWLIGSRGIEGGLLERALLAAGRLAVEYDPTIKGWPWSPETSSWVEPTSHALVALKKARRHRPQLAGVADRIDEGERMLADRRCPDGGWNYGNKRVLATDLPSYPETTAVALLGMQGSSEVRMEEPLAVGERHFAATRSRLAKAWLAIALRCHGRPAALEELPPPRDLCVLSLEALATAEGDKQWLRIG